MTAPANTLAPTGPVHRIHPAEIPGALVKPGSEPILKATDIEKWFRMNHVLKVRILSELSLNRPFQFWWLSIFPSPSSVKSRSTSSSEMARRSPTPSTFETGTRTIVSLATIRR